MKSVNKIIMILVIFLIIVNSVSAYDMYFVGNQSHKIDVLKVYGSSNVFNLTLLIDNTNPADYIASNSETSYLTVRPVGPINNLVTVTNRAFRTNGVFIDKDVIEKVHIELRLPLTQTWAKQYKVQVAGITPDSRQKIASVIVEPQVPTKEVITNQINLEYLIFGIGGLILILLLIYFFDHFHLWRRFFGGKKKW